GTAIQLRLHGVPRGTRCRLVTLNRGGQTQVAGTWQATYEATTAITTATSIARDNLRSLRVLTADNALLVAIPVPPR
ncbi:MAG: hypothetical protein ACRDRL_29990, partial [Sciscionella sp.]